MKWQVRHLRRPLEKKEQVLSIVTMILWLAEVDLRCAVRFANLGTCNKPFYSSHPSLSFPHISSCSLCLTHSLPRYIPPPSICYLPIFLSPTLSPSTFYLHFLPLPLSPNTHLPVTSSALSFPSLPWHPSLRLPLPSSFLSFISVTPIFRLLLSS